jgi:hypothetical protein
VEALEQAEAPGTIVYSQEKWPAFLEEALHDSHPETPPPITADMGRYIKVPSRPAAGQAVACEAAFVSTGATHLQIITLYAVGVSFRIARASFLPFRCVAPGDQVQLPYRLARSALTGPSSWWSIYSFTTR